MDRGRPEVCSYQKVEKDSGKELLLFSQTSIMPELLRKNRYVQHLANVRNYRKLYSQFYPMLSPLALFVGIMDMALSERDGWIPRAYTSLPRGLQIPDY